MLAPAILPLFVYGTLLDETFIGHLLEHPVRAEPAVLIDFELLELPALAYPIVCQAPGERVAGRIYRQLSAPDYVRLDAYEGVGEGLYRRISAEAVAGDGAAAGRTPEPVFVYVPTGQTLRRYG